MIGKMKMESMSNLFLENLLSDQAFDAPSFSDDSVSVDLRAKENVSLDKTIAYSDKTKKTWPIHPTK